MSPSLIPQAVHAQAVQASPLHIVCGWCKRVIREGDRSKPWSHGICADDAETFRAQAITVCQGEQPDELGATVNVARGRR